MTDDCTCSKCNDKRNRIAAFGAIRRAATHARNLERLAAGAWGGNAQQFTDRYSAHQIRNAIRLAIGSDKT